MPGADYIGCLAADNGISRGMVGGERATMGLRTLITGWTMEWGQLLQVLERGTIIPVRTITWLVLHKFIIDLVYRIA